MAKHSPEERSTLKDLFSQVLAKIAITLIVIAITLIGLAITLPCYSQSPSANPAAGNAADAAADDNDKDKDKDKPKKSFLQLSSGTPPPLNTLSVQLTNAGPGASANGQPADVSPFTISADFGDLSRVVNGIPAQAGVGLRVRSSVSYAVVMTLVSFNAINLQYQGNPIDSQDRGSFIRCTAGRVAATGPDANSNGSNINGALFGSGLTLNQLISGGINPAGTRIVAGSAASSDGDEDSPGNAVEVPVFFSVPTGLALGPIDGSGSGRFSANLQFGIFPQP
jgi:hypothetical protein